MPKEEARLEWKKSKAFTTSKVKKILKYRDTLKFLYDRFSSLSPWHSLNAYINYITPTWNYYKLHILLPRNDNRAALSNER